MAPGLSIFPCQFSDEMLNGKRVIYGSRGVYQGMELSVRKLPGDIFGETGTDEHQMGLVVYLKLGIGNVYFGKKIHFEHLGCVKANITKFNFVFFLILSIFPGGLGKGWMK